ncbi:unnamed protein product [Meganyctiphanes norvegica]|uniref:Uncharacterized protein n=1 Tax=Meganyctiphanes norvegica TaxID=48144 RepID=A0AAV2QGR3_MEGNR
MFPLQDFVIQDEVESQEKLEAILKVTMLFGTSLAPIPEDTEVMEMGEGEHPGQTMTTSTTPRPHLTSQVWSTFSDNNLSHMSNSSDYLTFSDSRVFTSTSPGYGFTGVLNPTYEPPSSGKPTRLPKWTSSLQFFNSMVQISLGYFNIIILMYLIL